MANWISANGQRFLSTFLKLPAACIVFLLAPGFPFAHAQVVNGPGGESLFFNGHGTFNLNNSNLTIIGLGDAESGVAFPDTAQINLGSGRLTLAGNSYNDFGGTISGTGNLVLSGTGNLVLSGQSTYSGGTILNSGILSISSDVELGNPIGGLTINGGELSVAWGATLTRNIVLGGTTGIIGVLPTVFSRVETVALAGQITGPGSLNLTDVTGGNGGFIISGNNTYQGGTTITATTATIASDSALGSPGTPVTVSSDGMGTGGLLIFDGSFATDRNISLNNCYCGLGVTSGNTATVSGVVRGAFLGVAGPGTLVLTGDNTYSGGTVISGGTLAISSDANLGASGTPVSFSNYFGSTLQFLNNTTVLRPIFIDYGAAGTIDTNGHDVTLAMPITSEQGFFAKAGDGTLTLTGINTMTETSVGAGTLALGSSTVPAQMSGAVNVSPGATFSANGVVIGAVFYGGGSYFPEQGLGNNGTVIIPASTAQLSLQGSYSQSASATLAVHVAPNGSGGLVATGTAALAGTLNILPDPGLYLAGTSLRILYADDGISGAFTSATSPTPNFSFDVVQTKQELDIAFLQTVSNGSGNFSGVISGTGGLTQLSGTEGLSGVNTYTGSTVVEAGGVLALVDGGSVSASSGVTADGSFDISGTTAGASITTLSGAGTVALGSQALTISKGSGNFSGVIGGSGGLYITSGAQILSGTNAYSGGTTVMAGGTLQLGKNNALLTTGAVLVNGGTFDLHGFDQTIGDLSGSSGTVALGGATLTEGTTNNTVYAGVLTGGGSFTKQGTGTLALTGDNSGFTGGTNIATGTIQLGTGSASATLGGSVTVSSAGTLVGSGTIVGTLTNNGTVNLSSGARLLNVAGFTQGTSGVLQGTVTPTSATLIKASGAVSLNGTLQLTIAPGTYAPSSVFVLAEGASETGTFSNVAFVGSNTVFGTFHVGTQLDLRPLILHNFSTSNNQMGAAQALDDGFVAGSAAFQAAYGIIAALPQARLPRALQSLSGEIDPTVAVAHIDVLDHFAAVLDSRLASGAMGIQYWAKGYGGFGNISESDGVAGYDTSFEGGTFGVDAGLGNGFIVGAAFGRTDERVNLTALSEYGDHQSYQLAVYSRTRIGGGIMIDGSVQGGLDEYSINRSLAPTGVGGSASSKHDGSAIGFDAKVSKDFAWSNIKVTPHLAIDHANVMQDSYVEIGGGTLALANHPNSLNSLRSSIGFAVSRFLPPETNSFQPEIQLGWRHQFLEDFGSVRSAYVGSPSQSFTVRSAEIGKNAVEYGAGVTYPIVSNVVLFARYDGTSSNKTSESALEGGLHASW